MSDTTNLLFLGLPATGKSTFFVAVDEVLERQNDESGLISDGFAANRTYIDAVKAAWRSGKEVGRTERMNLEEPVELLVHQRQTNRKARLSTPDVNGEFFDDQWTNREWTADYKRKLSTVAGICVFIHAVPNARNPEIVQAWVNAPKKKAPKLDPKMASEAIQPSESAAKPAEATSKKRQWEARLASRGVKQVELLQFMTLHAEIPRPVRLAVIISAWDEVESRDKPTRRPDDFLRTEWALLYQFLASNPEQFLWKAFGVSARGGDDQAQAKLRNLLPRDRVWLQEELAVTKDLTRPLRWVLNWE